jgi:hypothetical protein
MLDVTLIGVKLWWIRRTRLLAGRGWNLERFLERISAVLKKKKRKGKAVGS